MEALISNFNFIPQDGAKGDRQKGSSSFVRAHVMSQYHRRRRKVNNDGASKRVKFTNGATLCGKGQVETVRQLANVYGSTEKFRSTPDTPGGINHVISVSMTEEQPRRPKTESSILVDEQSVSITENKCRSWNSRQKAAQNNIKDTPAIRNLRPRDPREEDSSMFVEIFNAYSAVLDKRQSPLDSLTRVWLPAAFADLALFHAIIFNFSQHMFALCSIDHEKPSILNHKVQAIRAISSRLESPALATADSIIAAILCLVSHEFLTGDIIALRAHMAGLRRLVAMRGKSEVGLEESLVTMYLSYELLLATVFPSWAGDASPVSISPTFPAPYGIFTLSRDAVDPLSHGYSQATVQLLFQLCQLLSASDTFFTSYTATTFQQPAESLAEICAKEPLINEVDHQLQSVRFATLLYISAPSPTTKYVNLLKYHLTRTPILSFWHPIPGALLWCLIVGLRASEATIERRWFMANLIRVTTALAFKNWDGLCCTLYSFSLSL